MASENKLSHEEHPSKKRSRTIFNEQDDTLQKRLRPSIEERENEDEAIHTDEVKQMENDQDMNQSVEHTLDDYIEQFQQIQLLEYEEEKTLHEQYNSQLQDQLNEFEDYEQLLQIVQSHDTACLNSVLLPNSSAQVIL